MVNYFCCDIIYKEIINIKKNKLNMNETLGNNSGGQKETTPKVRHNIAEQFSGKVRELTLEEIRDAKEKFRGSRFWIIVMKDGTIKTENVDWNADAKCIDDILRPTITIIPD